MTLRREAGWVAAACAAASFVLLGDSLLSGGRVLPSLPLTDLGAHALPTLGFLARALRAGELPLWNPHSFSGQPFLGDFEPGVLYPLNWLAVPLGPAAALALSSWLHLALAGAAAYALCRARGASPLASSAGAAAYALAAPTLLLLAPGHFAPLAVVAWAPALLLCLSEWTRTRRARWALGAAAASAAQWLAGYPQMAYLSAVFCGAWALWEAERSARSHAAAAGVAAALLGGLVLAAAQVLPGLETAADSVRGGGLGAAEAARFSLPPENLLTALSPWALGGLAPDAPPYFGRGYVWEHCAFFGRVALALAFAGALGQRRARPLAAAALAALLLSLGPATPLFALARALLPGFSSLRGSAKALFLVPLFLAPVAAAGLDAAREAHGARRVAWASVALAAFCAAVTAAFAAAPGVLARGLAALGASEGVELSRELYRSASFAEAAAYWSVTGFAAAAGVLAAAAAVALGASARARARLLALGLAAELAGFAWSARASSPAVAPYPPEWSKAAASLADGERVLHDPFSFPNAALSVGALDAWGYAALVPRRYAELLAGTQGLPPESARNLFPFTREHRALDLARLRLVLGVKQTEGGARLAERRRPGTLPPALLLSDWRRLAPREALSAVLAADFRPDRAAVVEEDLPFPPAGAPRGSVAVSRPGVNRLEAEVASDRPALVVLPESWARGWRARAAGEPVRLLPADYAFLSFVVPAGRTRVSLEYRPASFVAGAVLSFLGIISWAALWIAKPR